MASVVGHGRRMVKGVEGFRKENAVSQGRGEGREGSLQGLPAVVANVVPHGDHRGENAGAANDHDGPV
jgi:hypothetical protein